MSARPDSDRPAPASEGTGPEEETDGGALPTLEELAESNDVEGLLALAKAYRAGTDGAPRDLAKCLACYQAAAKLGSAEAAYSEALFYLQGGVVEQNLKEGAARLRTAADGGFVPAKVYLANLYELGIHYAPDPEKADVWYRSAARAAIIDASPDSREYNLAMAELGCARHALLLLEDASVPPEERERYLKKAKAYGYQLRTRRESSPPSSAQGGKPVPKEAAAAAATHGETPKASPRAPEPKAPRADAPSRMHALSAFAFETMFLVASAAAGHLATLGARELVQQGRPVPFVGARVDLILPLVIGVVGVLPAFLMYKAGTVLRAIVVGAIAAGAGYAAWGAPHVTLLAGKELQALVFGVAGFLATLLVLGFFGGAKPPRKPIKRVLS